MKKEIKTRTQVLLEPEQIKKLAAIAEEEGRSVSSLLREWVDDALKARQQKIFSAAAKALAESYYSDGELTGYSSIDDDSFFLKEQR